MRTLSFLTFKTLNMYRNVYKRLKERRIKEKHKRHPFIIISCKRQLFMQRSSDLGVIRHQFWAKRVNLQGHSSLLLNPLCDSDKTVVFFTYKSWRVKLKDHSE